MFSNVTFWNVINSLYEDEGRGNTAKECHLNTTLGFLQNRWSDLPFDSLSYLTHLLLYCCCVFFYWFMFQCNWFILECVNTLYWPSFNLYWSYQQILQNTLGNSPKRCDIYRISAEFCAWTSAHFMWFKETDLIQHVVSYVFHLKDKCQSSFRKLFISLMYYRVSSSVYHSRLVCP